MTTTRSPQARRINSPMPFPGTDEQVALNRASHLFFGLDDRCLACDAKPWGIIAQWQCGIEPPRVELTIDEWREAMNL